MITSGQTLRTSVIVATVLAAAVAVAAVIVRAQVVVLTLFAAIVIAETLRPMVDRWSVRMPRAAATAIAFAALYTAVALVWIVPLYALAPQFDAFAKSLPTRVQGALAMIDQLSKAHGLGSNVGQSLSAVSVNVPQLLGNFVGIQANIAGIFSILGLAAVMAIFWMTSSIELRDFFLSLFPAGQRNDVHSLLGELSGKLGLYLLGTLINGAIVAGACAIGLALLHVPDAIVLGLLQAPLVALPYVGTFIGVIVVAVFVLAAQGPIPAAEATTLVIIVSSIEGTFISPLIFKQHLNVDPLATIVGIAVGGALFGFWGIVLAVPSVAILQTLTTRVFAPAIRRQLANV